jgi:predicted dehydrogenase
VQSHAEAYRRHRDAILVGVSDPDPDRRARAQNQWDVPAGFASVEELLQATEPEVVSVCSPDATHATVLRTVLSAPSVRGVLAEKPLALSVEEAREVVQLADERGVVLAVNYCRRFTPSHRALRDWLAAGFLGPIESVTGRYVRGIMHNGTHWLDLARFLVGEVQTVAGQPAPWAWDPDPTIDVALTFQSGARGTLQAVHSAEYTLFEMELYGSRGRARLVDSGNRFELAVAGPSRRFPGFQELQDIDGPQGGLFDLLQHPVNDLLRAVVERNTPLCTGADGVVALELAQRAIETARRLTSTEIVDDFASYP